jgi:hypothetical protein
MTTALKFRNVDASPDDPVETWPFEGILAAVERGTLPDWDRLATAIRVDPWGPVAQGPGRKNTREGVAGPMSQVSTVRGPVDVADLGQTR